MKSLPRPYHLTFRMLLVSIAGLGLLGCSSGETTADNGATDANVPIGLTFEYPPEWKSTLSAARSEATFSNRIPNHPAANQENITQVFINPKGTVVVMRFPSPHEPSAPVRQDYLEIHQEPWQAKLSPEEAWAQVLAEYPGTMEIRMVEGTPVLVGKPHSDQTGQDPAHVQFVQEGTHVEIFGNDDTDLLLGIAQTMLKG